ncbi:M1 family aminopeptidase [Chryseobacterium sp.]|uniref:M1 family aminopeptidase n=1 Tax=Chryseobacterium sp. TaxID=1871047 RepID=UPI0031D8E6A5
MKKILFLLINFFCLFLYSQVQKQRMEMRDATHEERSSKKMTTFNINPHTLNYDLKYQRMDVEIDPAVQYINGSVTSHFKTNQSMKSIYFDLSDSLTVSQVQYHGSNINFQQLPTKEIKIDFPEPIAPGVLDSIKIQYSGAPATSYTGFFTKSLLMGIQNGVPIASSLNQPYGAQDWFPTKQNMNDKIEQFDFKITTPSQYSVAANGKLISETILSNGKKQTFWRTMYPTAAYLIGIAITNFTKLNDTIGNPPFSFINYIYPSTLTNTASMLNIEWTKQAMNLFETYFGPYPFRNEKYGHMEFNYPAGGLEHQTMSSMGQPSVGTWRKDVIAHELAHQWFGNKVTCGAWNDIWLNEGFATFGEHLVNEKLIMPNTDFIAYLLEQKDKITSLPGGRVYVSDANLQYGGITFDSRLTYAKGGYIVRMIKWILGEPVFYQALKDYHSRPNFAYNYVRTTDLNSSLLQSTGKDFTEFFNDWVYGEGYPTYDIKWKQSANQITFKVSQTQSHVSVNFFEMPLPIKVNGTGGEVAYLTLDNTSNNQNFTQTIMFPVANIQFNYEYQILEKDSTVTMDNTLSTTSVEFESFDLYPNPTKNELYVTGISRASSYNIYFTDGKLVKTGTYQPGKGVRLLGLSPGIYILTIQDRKIKFIKQ